MRLESSTDLILADKFFSRYKKHQKYISIMNAPKNVKAITFHLHNSIYTD